VTGTGLTNPAPLSVKSIRFPELALMVFGRPIVRPRRPRPLSLDAAHGIDGANGPLAKNPKRRLGGRLPYALQHFFSFSRLPESYIRLSDCAPMPGDSAKRLDTGGVFSLLQLVAVKTDQSE
jgi:hypothetical protein